MSKPKRPATTPAVPAIESKRAGNPNWKPGVSGNPGGRKPIPPEVREAARALCPRAIERLGELMEQDESYSVTAAQAILDRGYGKPMQPIAITPVDASDADLIEMAKAALEVLAKDAP